MSSFGSDFNCDDYVSFTEEQIAKESAWQNYQQSKPWGLETVGISVFFKDETGQVFHTCACDSRGVDMMNGAYHSLDLAPKGRDEVDQVQAWVRRHDAYEN